MNKLFNTILCNGYFFWFIIIFVNIWIFLWAIYGGKLSFNNNININELGLGLNPPMCPNLATT
jgi:hypothetical protein